MAVKGYTTEQKIENYILQDIDARMSTQITEWIEGIERVIDAITGRNFKADSSDSARLYDGDDDQILQIDDCISISKVEVGNDDYGGTFTEIAATGADRYFAMPNNYSALGLPISSLMLNSRYWPAGKQNNRITAKWGYSAAVPADIVFAATVFVAGILNQHRGGGDKVKSERIGNYQVTYSDDQGDSWGDFRKALDILDSYKKINL